MKHEKKGIVLAMLAAVVSGFSIPLNKMFVAALEPAVFTMTRSLLIGVVFFILAFWQTRKHPNILEKISGRGRITLSKAPWKWLLIIALIGGSMAFLFFFTGLKLTTAGRGAFIQKTLPLFATLMAVVFLREKVGRKGWTALLAMLLGLLAISYAQIGPSLWWESPSIGDALILLATILWAVENVIARKVLKEGQTSFVVIFARMFFGGLFILAAACVMGNPAALLKLSASQSLNVLASTGLLLMYVLFWYSSLKLLPVSKASPFLLLAPVISLGIGVFCFGEPAPVLQLAGSALILAGAYCIAKTKDLVVAV